MTVLIAALAGCSAAGVLLAVAGLTGRSVPQVRASKRRSGNDLLRCGWAVAAGGAAVIATGWLVAGGLALVAAWNLPSLLGGRGRRQDEIARAEAIASWAEMVRDSIAAAAGLEEAITATATVAPMPLRSHVRALVRRLDHERLPDALERFGQDVAHPSCDLVVAALTLAARLEASDLSSLLSRLAEAARDDARMRIRIEVGRTRIRTATSVIVGVVFAGVIFLTVASRGYLDVYDTGTGQVALAVVAGVFLTGGWLLKRMSAIEVPERFVARLDPGVVSP